LLGDSVYDLTAWYGQALQWTDLLKHTLPDGGRAVAVDGHVRRCERGSLRLVLRAWTVLMEDGPYVHLELVPQYRPPETRDLRDLLRSRAFEGERFDSLALELQLAGGYAYLLTTEAPGVEWTGPEPEGDTGADEVGRQAVRPPLPASRGSMGPVDPLGPGAAVPPTLGELMLRGDVGPPSRGVIVLVPRIPPELSPPG
jgi:hypothetical protein